MIDRLVNARIHALHRISIFSIKEVKELLLSGWAIPCFFMINNAVGIDGHIYNCKMKKIVIWDLLYAINFHHSETY